MAAICVFCSSSTAIDEVFLDVASQVGAQIAARGHRLVTGGGAISMMGAVARSARAGGAHTLGIIPQVFVEAEHADVDSDELVITADLRERKAKMSAASDAFIVLPGGIGTLEELFDVWVSLTVSLHTKPVVVCDPMGVFDSFRAALGSLAEAGFVRQSSLDQLVWVADAAEALDAVEGALLKV